MLGGLSTGAIGGWVGYNQLTSQATDAQSFWYPTGGGIVGVLLGLVGVFILIFLWNLFWSPYRRMNEATRRVGELEAELEQPKLFDVVCATRFIGLPINRLDDGSYNAASAQVGPVTVLFVHRGDLTNVMRFIASPQIRFIRADEKGWETSNAIRVMPGVNSLAGPLAKDFAWDTSDPNQWILTGLPLAMAKDEHLPIPLMLLSVVDANEAGAHFENGEKCELIVKLAVRTDKGSPSLPDQVIPLTRSDFRDTDLYKRVMEQQAEAEGNA